MKQISKYQVAQVSATVLTGLLALAPVALAQFTTPNAGGTGLPNDSSLSGFILKIINIALTVAGLIAVLFLIIGGFDWLIAGDSEVVRTRAKRIILGSLLGEVIVLLAWAIVTFLFGTVQNVTT